jgi:hypothetical protein
MRYERSVRVRAGRRRGIPAILALVCALTAGPAFAAGVEIATSNDLGAGNPFEDDRYTASFRASWLVRDHLVTFDEHMFTDRDAGRRFDESWLRVRGSLVARGRDAVAWRLGAVRVGRGLVGERGQNVVHRAVGSDQVDLAYEAGARFHPTAAVEWTRRAFRSRNTLTFARAEVSTAPGFRDHVEVGIDGVVALGRGLLLSATAGLRGSRTDHDLLARHLESWTAVGEVGITYRGWFRLAGSANRLGVRQRHLHVGFRLPFLGGR